MSFAAGRPVLAIPGPSPVPDRVLRAMHRPAPDIYAGELVGTNATAIAGLKRLAGTRHHLAPYIGNGHAGWEAANANLFAPSARSPGANRLAMRGGRPRTPTCSPPATGRW